VTSYPNSSARTLSDTHSRELKDSDIATGVAAARGYRTIRHRSEVPNKFADWQRRLGLLVPTYSPDGKTKGHQLKPNKPIRRKDGSTPKYETPAGSTITLDVNPLMLEAIRHGDGDLWITEGCKKVDSLASRGEPAIGFIGVWNMAVPKTKGTVPLPCWRHVRLRARRVIIVFDADARTNPSVQEALGRAVTMLESLGAVVLVVYLPAVNGDPKAGIDDHFAAGGTVAELRLMAAPYQPVDVGAERMSGDEKLRAALEELRAAWWGTDWNQIVGTGDKPHWMRGYTARDVEEAMLRLAARWGKVTPQGVRFTAGLRTITDEAGKGKPATGKAIKHLEAEGRLLIHEPEGGQKARSYTLLVGRAHRYHKGGQGDAGVENVTPELQVCDPCGNGLRAPDVPRLRWSAPAQHKRIVRRKQLVAGRVRSVSFVIGEDRPRIVRLDPRRGAIVDYLEASGGRAMLQEICEVLDVKRLRDLRRRLLPMLEEAGIIECEGDVISLTAVWGERLEEERRRGGEIEAQERQKARHDEERRQHREDGLEEPAEKPPPLMGPEKVQKIVEARGKEDLAARIEHQRQKVGITAETYVFDKLQALGQIRLALLMEVYADAGGDPWDIPPAVRGMGCRIERLPEYGNWQFVFPPAERVA
jgi:Domain of unknown function (DUF3854)